MAYHPVCVERVHVHIINVPGPQHGSIILSPRRVRVEKWGAGGYAWRLFPAPLLSRAKAILILVFQVPEQHQTVDFMAFLALSVTSKQLKDSLF